MGLDYSLVTVTDRPGLDPLLRAIADRLAEEDRRRLLDALPWRPASDQVRPTSNDATARDARGIAGLRLEPDHERENDYCLSFLFETDGPLAEFVARYGPMGGDSPPGMSRVGCIWVSVAAGDQVAVVTATAATTDMSLLFRDSPSVRRSWTAIAEAGRVAALFFDSEELDRWELLFPAGRNVPKPDDEAYLFEDDFRVGPDVYYGEALRLAAVGRFDGPP